jgi:GNAT superfamily N-acetyltransferase
MSRAPLQLRRATVDDAERLARLGARTFRDTYRGLDDPQDIEAYVGEHFTPARVAAQLRRPASVTLLAQCGDEDAGYLQVAVSEAPACVEGPAPVELVRLYLREEWIGGGHGTRMMRAAEAEALRLQGRTLWLGVYEKNLRAVAFYRRCGFEQVGTHDFLFAGVVYADPVMAKPLEPPR